MVQDLFREKKNKIAISCSIGISLFPAHGHDFRSLYQCADIALYQAKGKGKNTSCLYSAQMLHPALESHYSGSPIDSDRLGTVNTRQLTEYVFQTLYLSLIHICTPLRLREPRHSRGCRPHEPGRRCRGSEQYLSLIHISKDSTVSSSSAVSGKSNSSVCGIAADTSI